jgi:hypothetical protein
MKKIPFVLMIAIGVAMLATLVSSSFVVQPKLFVAPSIQAVDYFANDPIEVLELVTDNTQTIEKFKVAGSRLNGVNMVGAGLDNSGNISRTNLNKEDASAHFEYERETGSLSISKGIMGQMNVLTSKNLPSEEQAKQVASQYLADNQLTPRQKDQLVVERVGGLKMMTQNSTVDMMKTVYYGRQIKGVPVSGSGSQIVMNIGNGGQVLSVSRKWRDVNSIKSVAVAPGGSKELKTQKEAENEFAVFVSQVFNNAPYKLESIEKMYFDNSGKYIQPVFLINAKINTPQGTTLPLIQPISMLKNAPEKVGFDAQQLKAEVQKSGISNQKTHAPNIKMDPKMPPRD